MSNYTNTSTLKILVCGGRDYSDRQKLNKTLDDIIKFYKNKSYCIIQGGAKGADSLAKDYAFENGIPCLTIDAQWHFYGQKAGSLRNKWMLQFGVPDILVAFKGGFGTKNMIDLANLAQIPVYNESK